MPRSAPAVADTEATVSIEQQTPQALTALQQDVFAIMQTHCANCHSATPTDDIFVIAPLGLMFDNWQQVEARAPLIYQRAAVTKDMPMMNKTGMTDAEREVISLWFTNLK
jgi:uncharacterized membrane protein